MKIYPSIASSNCLEYGNEVRRINTWPYLHLDIEDGNFTPNITFGLKTIRAIMGASKASDVQVHLMVTNPIDYLEECKALGVRAVYGHIESLEDPKLFIEKCHVLGMKAGLALKAMTSITSVEKHFDDIDGILFLTSAFQGKTEEFYEPALQNAMDASHSIPKYIEKVADGGLDEGSVMKLAQAGFSGIVLGRLVFGNDEPIETMKRLSKY